MDYKSETEELQEQLDLLKKIIIYPLAISLIFSLTFYLIKFF
jgi:fructose-specific phosphotransferase system IIC component